MKQALVIIDVQREYFPGGKLELYRPECALTRTGKALRLFRERGWPVFFVRHVSPRADAPIFRPGTTGVELHPELDPREGETVMDKHFPNSFLGTGLRESLASRHVRHLVICGMMTHMCIDTTVRAAWGGSFRWPCREMRAWGYRCNGAGSLYRIPRSMR